MIKHGTISCKRAMCLLLVCFEQYLSLEQVVCEFSCVEASTSLVLMVLKAQKLAWGLSKASLTMSCITLMRSMEITKLKRAALLQQIYWQAQLSFNQRKIAVTSLNGFGVCSCQPTTLCVMSKLSWTSKKNTHRTVCTVKSGCKS